MPKSSSPAADSAALRALPARRICAALGAAAERWSNADFPPRVRATAALMARTGYTEPVIDYALDRLFEGMTERALRAAIDGELGSLDALDGFVAREGRPDAFARGVERVAIVASDTTIGIALPATAFALCAKCAVTVRDRSDALLAAFAETLAQEREEFAAALRVHAGVERDDPAWRASLERADVVVAYGGDAAMRELRAAAGPEARFVAYGHRTSAAYVEAGALRDDAAARDLAVAIARDALLYDGEGCLSAHAVFVERGAATGVEAFAEALAAACAAAAVEFPRGAGAPHGATVAYRDAARFRVALGNGGVEWGDDGAYLLAVDPPRDEPPPLLPRALALYAVDGPEEFAAFVRRHALPLEAVAVADPARAAAGVVAAIVASGAARIARAGTLQAPSLAGEHGGIGRIAPFVRWIVRDP
jgi:acyl-CoA reductase LuxC